MTFPRLTSREYWWFGKSQFAASIYSQSQNIELDPAVADIILTVKNDAKTYYTGPQSLRRLAERLDNEAADIVFMESLSVLDDEKHAEAKRRVEVMRCLSSRFLAIADELQAVKGQASS